MDAFVVTLKHACSRGEAGLMSPLLRRASAGAEDISVFQQKASYSQHPKTTARTVQYTC